MKINIVDCDDWFGLYIDGKLVFENHRLEYYDILQAISSRLDNIEFEISEVDYDWMDGRGALPKKLEKVKLEQQ